MLSGVKVARRISSIECFSNINVFFFERLQLCEVCKRNREAKKYEQNSVLLLASAGKYSKVCSSVCASVCMCVKAAKLMAASVLIDPAGVCLRFGAHRWLLVACPGNA